MRLNLEIFKEVELFGAKILVVTKYFSAEVVFGVLPILQKNTVVLGVGENRTEILVSKNLPRDFTHFIGKIQSRKITEIVQKCSVLHSLDNLAHAKKLDVAVQKFSFEPFGVFVQINVSEEPQKGGISPLDLENFLRELKKFKNLHILGISAMGSGKVGKKEKHKEFMQLKNLRDTFIPEGKISAGTSRDYQIALECGIDIVRVGEKCFLKE